MGSGFAVHIKTRYPAAYEKYKSVEKLQLGSVVCATISPYLLIANCITQQNYGRDQRVLYISYEAVTKSLTTVANSCYNKMSVHLPFIGGGLANGDRGKLLSIFADVFSGEGIKATLWVD